MEIPGQGMASKSCVRASFRSAVHSGPDFIGSICDSTPCTPAPLDGPFEEVNGVFALGLLPSFEQRLPKTRGRPMQHARSRMGDSLPLAESHPALRDGCVEACCEGSRR